MYCQQCGSEIDEGLAFCTSCGAKQVNNVAPTQFTPENNGYNQQNNQGVGAQQYSEANKQNYAYAQPNVNTFEQNGFSYLPKKVSFGESIKLFFKNYANFTGRATKAEYWWACLFVSIVSFCASLIPYAGLISTCVFLIPSLSVAIRRLHDTGKSWVYILIALIPLAGPIILIVQYCKNSVSDNQWGPFLR